MTLIANSTSAFFLRSSQGIAALRARTEKLQQQMSSGSKLVRSSDNPLAASQLRGLARNDALTKVDTTNADRATGDLNLADTALSSFADYIERAKELTTQAATSTLSPSQRASIGDELLQLHGSLISLANTRNGSGQSLFGGEAAGNAYGLDGSGNAVYGGTASAGDLPLGDGQSVKRGLTGPEFLNFKVGGVPTDLLAVVKALGDALKGGVADPAGAARSGLDSLNTALDAVTTGQTQIGARLAWIDLTNQRRTALGEMHSGEEASLGSTDLAATVAELQQTMLVLQASQASFARLASLSLFDLLR
jgi:flagellar hook-associated protein 3 FlgL